MIREERELLAELARLNRELAPLAMRIMEGSASSAEQQDYAERLIAAGESSRNEISYPLGCIIQPVTSGDVYLSALVVPFRFQRLRRRVNETSTAIIEGEILSNDLPVLPAHTALSPREL